jgi:predicted transcriptional regulator/transcriptional regulator with XRE-family HTH domain
MSQTPHLGSKVRALRRRHTLTQVEFARQLGISSSYVNLIEHNRRPVTANLLIKLARQFKVDVLSFAREDDERLLEHLLECFSDDLFEEQDLTNTEMREFVTHAPGVARAVLGLFEAYREGRESSAALISGDADGGGGTASSAPGRLPSEEVGDLIQSHLNYFPELEEGAQRTWTRGRLSLDNMQEDLQRYLREHLMVDVRVSRAGQDSGAMKRYDPDRRELTLSELLPPRSRNFQLAHQIALLSCSDAIDRILGGASFSSPDSENLARVALANYYAGAVLMPYDQFLAAARQERYDIELLGHRFRTSVEQICHRLTTLRRPGHEGVPFHMVRVDIAGNISKRFSATGIRFARFGAACPLWNVFQAFLSPGRIRVQLSTMPGGESYFCFATTIPKGRGGFHAPHTVHAIGIGCTVDRAPELIYSDGMDLGNLEAGVPIGVTCRLCDRMDCAQRAFPPVHQPMRIDPNLRGVSSFVPVPR